MSLACGDYKAASGSELFRRQGKTEKKDLFLSFWTSLFCYTPGVDLVTTPLTDR